MRPRRSNGPQWTHWMRPHTLFPTLLALLVVMLIFTMSNKIWGVDDAAVLGRLEAVPSGLEKSARPGNTISQSPWRKIKGQREPQRGNSELKDREPFRSVQGPEAEEKSEKGARPGNASSNSISKKINGQREQRRGNSGLIDQESFRSTQGPGAEDNSNKKNEVVVAAVHGHDGARIAAVRETWLKKHRGAKIICPDGGGTRELRDMHIFLYNCKGAQCEDLKRDAEITRLDASLSALERTVSMFKNVYEKHPDSAFIVKVDDDAWFNGTQLLRQLCTHQDPYMGFVMEVDKQRFASGGAGYILSTKLFKMHPEILSGACGANNAEDLGMAKCIYRVANGLEPTEMPGMYPDTPEKMLSWTFKPSYDHRSRFHMGVEPITFHYISAQRNLIVADEQRQIPKRLHMIWIGKKYPPMRSLLACSKANRDFELFIWTEETVKDIKFDSIYQNEPFVLQKLEETVYEKYKKSNVKKLAHDNRILFWTDLLRIEVLYLYGGVYIDADSICIRSLAPLLGEADAFAAYESEKYAPKLVANGVMGFRQYGALAWELFQQVLLLDIDSNAAWKSTGPCLLSYRLFYRILPQFRQKETRTKLCGDPIGKGPPPLPTNEKLLLYPSSKFYPTHFRDEAGFSLDKCKQALSSGSYTFQLWGSTHRAYQNTLNRNHAKDLQALRIAHKNNQDVDLGVKPYEFSNIALACQELAIKFRRSKKNG